MNSCYFFHCEPSTKTQQSHFRVISATCVCVTANEHEQNRTYSVVFLEIKSEMLQISPN